MILSMRKVLPCRVRCSLFYNKLGMDRAETFCRSCHAFLSLSSHIFLGLNLNRNYWNPITPGFVEVAGIVVWKKPGQ
ncbi:hypothetical protein LWI29_027046 [Acer saccharum]|uniref:Uncharacterized protein n=1 Tax=Acer saccharum TaxID=4024 RepID=A0AA39T6T8_ACESA|nr:hypothetical protein LWI29_027046 [Acer saccharum]